MSRFYMDETYIPKVQKLLNELSPKQIGERLGFCRETVIKFMHKHNLNAKTNKR